MRRARVLAVLVLLVVGATGCGGDDDGGGGGGGGGPAVGLLDRLTPGDVPRAVIVDAAAVRQKLGVGAVRTMGDLGGADPAAQRYGTALGAALPFLQLAVKAPLLEVLDVGRIKAAATNDAGELDLAVAVLRTDQPAGEISAALTGGGYRADGSLFVLADPGRTRQLAVVGISGDLVAVGANADRVRAAVDGSAPGIHGAVREVLAGLNAPVASAFVRDTGCPRGVAIADRIDGASGSLVVLADPAEVDRFTALQDPYLGATLHFSQPTSTGDRVTADFTYPTDDQTHQPMTVLREAILSGIYRC